MRLRGAIQTTGEGCRSRDSGVHIVRLLQAVMTSMMKELKKKRMSTEGGGEGGGVFWKMRMSLFKSCFLTWVLSIWLFFSFLCQRLLCCSSATIKHDSLQAS